ncbi:hypothetical protein O181_074191 [Austropuccinia psidii MF-1]|uniref:Tet-like 2OG-Fe(II) oxygenase domain-containing protein n=1 Tax=Austropuccinia psidii MF-1 TaxID=1389203 RepID=A0A9Q3I901_9BASI|nr:hypothetical protein [Austropuccinia psidii MF-1]
MQTGYKSLGVPSFDQINYETEISTNQGGFEFASTLTFTLNGFKHSLYAVKDALVWCFQADKQTSQMKKDVSKCCSGGESIFPKEIFWIYLSECHGRIQVVGASIILIHYTDPAQEIKRTASVGMSAQFSRKLAKTMWQRSHGYYEIREGDGDDIRDGNTISSQLEE